MLIRIRFPRQMVLLALLAAVFVLMSCNWAFRTEPTPEPQITYIVITTTPLPTFTHAVLTPVVMPDFCSDPRVQATVDGLVEAVRSQNGQELVRWVHPEKGLVIRHEWWNPEVFFSRTETADLFSSAKTYNWGVQDGSGLSLTGTFQEIVLPRLLDVLDREHTRHCNTLEFGVATGGTAGLVLMPAEFSGPGFIALYRAAPPDVDMDWRTWAVGIEYAADGLPYATYLVQYHWEI